MTSAIEVQAEAWRRRGRLAGEVEQVGGVRGGARYLPWVLDGAMPQTRTAVLGMLPPPARVFYRTIWERRYRTSGRLTVG